MTSRCYRRFILCLLVIMTPMMQFAQAAAKPDERIIIALDAGHGGKDPGALGQNGLQEKTVNIAVAKKLYALLDKDPLFNPVMTRTGDYFISVSARSDIARSKNAHLLVSIHADAAESNRAAGSSVWVLSNKRADSELGRLLEQQEKQSELLGGGGDALVGEVNPYLSHAVIDLQFAHSQRVGYDVATKLISELGKVGALHKRSPEHASFGILRSPDIPSVLVEVGFISNANEEKLLKSEAYQEKLAKSIYQGIRRYFQQNPITTVIPTTEVVNSSAGQTAATGGQKTTTTTQQQTHVVKANETLYSISRQYGVPVASISQLNNLKNNNIWVGQRLKITVTKTLSQPAPAVSSTIAPAKPIKHKVVAGDSLSEIAQTYRVSASEIKKANGMKSDTVRLGQSLTIPQSN